MRQKIVSITAAIKIANKIKKQNKKIVVAGGFFDILHVGHIKFLQKSKESGDCLFILLENDLKAKKEKGMNRPINPQKIRATILSSIETVDYVVLLKNMTNNKSYDNILIDLKPDVISVTSGDPNTDRKKKQAKLIGAKILYAIKKIKKYSTTEYLKYI